MSKQFINPAHSKIITFLVLVLFIMSCCSSKNKKTDAILVYVKVFDKVTNEPRANDTIVVRIVEKPVLSMWQYQKIDEKLTNNLGNISIKLNKSKRYSFIINGYDGHFTSEELEADNLQEGDTILISMDSSKNKLKWIRE